MTTVVTIDEAKARLSALIAEAEAGGDVVILTGDGLPVRLVPARPAQARKFGALKGRISVGAAFDEPLPDHEITSWNG